MASIRVEGVSKSYRRRVEGRDLRDAVASHRRAGFDHPHAGTPERGGRSAECA